MPIGAAVTRGDDVLAAVGNRRELDEDPTAHAEIAALRAASAALGSWRLDECSLAVTLEPCAMCAAQPSSPGSTGWCSEWPIRRRDSPDRLGNLEDRG